MGSSLQATNANVFNANANYFAAFNQQLDQYLQTSNANFANGSMPGVSFASNTQGNQPGWNTLFTETNSTNQTQFGTGFGDTTPTMGQNTVNYTATDQTPNHTMSENIGTSPNDTTEEKPGFWGSLITAGIGLHFLGLGKIYKTARRAMSLAHKKGLWEGIKTFFKVASRQMIKPFKSLGKIAEKIGLKRLGSIVSKFWKPIGKFLLEKLGKRLAISALLKVLGTACQAIPGIGTVVGIALFAIDAYMVASAAKDAVKAATA